jgi:hypothetical protein
MIIYKEQVENKEFFQLVGEEKVKLIKRKIV